ncbi:PgaA family protein [Acinetobacter nectaris]|uniref:hypothetical protein n=1 Tax=Acinetobacter nectaris TaxID=1219382 RepID=UPI0006874A85|nr:hypothetical protein [Acinetobacter nectaris]
MTRETAVQMVYQGNIDVGISQLQQLLDNEPTNQKLLADYLTLRAHYQQFTESDLQHLKQIHISDYPSYAQIPTIQGLRNSKYFLVALAFTEKLYKQCPSPNLLLLKAILEAEAQQIPQAIEDLKLLPVAQLTVEQRLQVAYVWRITSHPLNSLNILVPLFESDPKNKKITEEYIQTLIALGNHSKALDALEKSNLSQDFPELFINLKLAIFSTNINDAIAHYKYLSNKGEPDQVAFKQLDETLDETNDLKKILTDQSKQYLMFYYDYVYALNFRKSFSEVLKYASQPHKPYLQMPAYVRHAIANAYLYLKQPQYAQPLYESLLQEKNYADMEVYSGLYYAYLEQEKYKEANELIVKIDQLIPTFIYSNALGTDKTTAPDRYEYIELQGLNIAYHNQLDLAENHFQKLVIKSPSNASYINDLSKIQRWRSLPLTAQATLRRLNGKNTIDKSTFINRLENFQALENINAWRTQLEQVEDLYPQDTSIQKSRKDLNARDKFTVNHETRLGRNTNNVGQDLESISQIYSPWVENNYRAFFTHQLRLGKYQTQKILSESYQTGLEWRSERKQFDISLSQSKRTGLMLNWSAWLNDHWQYNMGYNSQDPIPLQAIQMNYKGFTYTIGALWQKNESLSAKLAYQSTYMSDTNQQNDYSIHLTKRIFASPHHTTEAQLNFSTGTNRKQSSEYFSPATYLDSTLVLHHDWLTWRNYEQYFNQRFELGLGIYQQKNTPPLPFLSLQYLHDWALSDSWHLQYGMNFTNHPYNGQHENQLSGLIGIQGSF